MMVFVNKLLACWDSLIFDEAYYIDKYPDVINCGVSAHEHYLNFGRFEGRDTNRYGRFLTGLPKIVMLKIRAVLFSLATPILKKVLNRNKIERLKNLAFKNFPRFFKGFPSYHFWLSQNGSSLETHFLIDHSAWELLLPKNERLNLDEGGPQFGTVDVIIPIYKGFEQTKRCIESVLKSSCKCHYRLVLINDASPEREISDYLSTLSDLQNVIVLTNEKNLGFTETVNVGMNLSQNDVLLLNSDTQVSNDWLDKIKHHANSSPQIATVTPYSNNATICSYPTFGGAKQLPNGENVETLDNAFGLANLGKHIEIPTAVGFCMFIKRACLNQIGYFDVEAFGKGYGEENDFCMRASALGWKHLLAADTFVFHEGEVSFEASSNPRKKIAMDIIRNRYPDYERIVSEYISKDPGFLTRVAATAARIRMSGLPVVVHVLHNIGGGTKKHVDDLIECQSGEAIGISLTILSAGTVKLSSKSKNFSFELNLPCNNLELLAKFFESFNIKLIHIHHVLGLQWNLESLIEKLDVPFFFTVHDYFAICPKIFMNTIPGEYCGEPGIRGCNDCLSMEQSAEIIWWRVKYAWLFKKAALAICPSLDTLERCKSYYPNSNYVLVPHQQLVADQNPSRVTTPLDENERIRVVLLGAMSPHKGSKLLKEIVKEIELENYPINMRLVGYSDLTIRAHKSVYSVTGPYIDEIALVKEIKLFDPHVALFLSRCPETYSYTLTSVIENNLAVMAPRIGSFPERLIEIPYTWLYEVDQDASEIIQKLLEIRRYFIQQVPDKSPSETLHNKKIVETNTFYKEGYFSFVKRSN